MNRLIHILLPMLAICGGWWAGQSAPVSMASTKAEGGNSNLHTQEVAEKSPLVQSMLSRIPALRSRPGNGHEIEWVKWCLQIPDTDVAQTISHLDPSRDFHALRILYSRWAKLDFTTAWAAFLKSPIPTHDLHFYLSTNTPFNGLSSSRLHENPKDLIAMRMLASLKSVDSARAKQVIASFVHDSSAAAQSGLLSYNIASFKNGGDQDATVDYAARAQQATGTEASQNLSSWLMKDPSAAMDWFRNLSPEKQATFDYSHISWQITNMPGADALKFLQSTQAKALLDPSKIEVAAEASSYEHDRGYGNNTPQVEAATAIRKWASADPKAALAYVQQLPANDLQSMLLGQLAGQLAATDSAQAIALINEHPGNQTLGMKGLVSGWAQQQPTECWEWLNKISDPETLDSCVGTAVKQWSQTEPALAVKALSKVKDPATVKKTLDSIVQRLFWNQAELQRIQALAPQLPWTQAAEGGGG
jgi:hypothetical protein